MFRIHQIIEDEGIHVITKISLDAQTCGEMERRIVSLRSVLDVKSQSVFGKHEIQIYESYSKQSISGS